MRYTYGDEGGWGNLLIANNGVAITYDERHPFLDVSKLLQDILMQSNDMKTEASLALEKQEKPLFYLRLIE